MAIIYKTAGAWGAGSGAPLSAAQVDGNFYELLQRIAELESYPGGRSITAMTQNGVVLTVTFSDGSFENYTIPTQVQTPAIPLTVTATSLAAGVAHANRYMRCTNGAGCTVNFTTNSEEPFAYGDEIHFRQVGGALAFTHDSGVTLNPPAPFQATMNTLHGTVTWKYVGDDTWDGFGFFDLASA